MTILLKEQLNKTQLVAETTVLFPFYTCDALYLSRQSLTIITPHRKILNLLRTLTVVTHLLLSHLTSQTHFHQMQ